jgi:hypothetical protein
LKVVFVLGFYDPVKTALDSVYAERIKDESIQWIRQKSQGREVNLTEFSALYSKRIAAGMTSALLLIAKPRPLEWVVGKVKDIVERANEGHSISWQSVEFDSAGDHDGVLRHIADFGLQAPSTLTVDKIENKLPSGKILCVSLDGSTSVLEAMRRVGFSESVLGKFFEEERIPGARNSGLMQHLSECAKRYRYLLYAFQGLRTLTPEVKDKFERCYESPMASKLAALARRWLEGDP